MLSFVIPVYDEVEGIEAFATALGKAADALVDDGLVARWEAVLVDDGSTDGTGEVLDRLGAEDERIRPVHHPVNRGVGAAFATGVAATRGELIATTDADLPIDLADLGALVRPVVEGRCDLVSARRIGRSREGIGRAVKSYAYNALVRVVLGIRVRDVNFAAKVATRDAVPERFTVTSAAIDAEWLLHASRRGLRIEQPAVEFLPRSVGASSFAGTASIGPTLRDLVGLRRRSHAG